MAEFEALSSIPKEKKMMLQACEFIIFIIILGSSTYEKKLTINWCGNVTLAERIHLVLASFHLH